MDPREAFWTSTRALRARPLRSALTMTGLTVGVFAVIAAVTAVEVVASYFERSLAVLAPSVVEVQVGGPHEANRESRERPPLFTYPQVRRLEDRVRRSLQISVEAYVDRGRARFRDQSTEPNVFLLGSDAEYPSNYGFTLAAGRTFSRSEVRTGRAVALLGAAVAETLFPSVDPIGREIQFEGLRLEVVGVLSERGRFLGFGRDNRIVAPLPTLLDRYGAPSTMSSFTVRARTPARVPTAIDHVVGHLRVIRGLRPGEERDFRVRTAEARRERIETFTRALATGGAGVGLISLLAAGIGVMNVMLVSVTERTREIGVRKAVGAKRGHVLLQFLLEAVLLCQIGGLAGIALGVLFGNGVALYFDLRLAVPWGWALGSVGAMAAAALVFGGYPAYRAARVDPIESLRHP
ncbi:MAG: ABC transporter permease [Salinibacter sp.]